MAALNKTFAVVCTPSLWAELLLIVPKLPPDQQLGHKEGSLPMKNILLYLLLTKKEETSKAVHVHPKKRRTLMPLARDLNDLIQRYGGAIASAAEAVLKPRHNSGDPLPAKPGTAAIRHGISRP